MKESRAPKYLTRGIELFYEAHRWHWRVVEWSVHGTNATLVRGSTGDYPSASEAAYAAYKDHEPSVSKRRAKKIPPCAAAMGCLCVGHACGNAADAACDTNEERYR